MTNFSNLSKTLHSGFYISQFNRLKRGDSTEGTIITDIPMTVDRKGTVKFIAIEGELPFSFLIGLSSRFDYANLFGENNVFARIDRRLVNNFSLYFGNKISLREIGLEEILRKVSSERRRKTKIAPKQRKKKDDSQILAVTSKNTISQASSKKTNAEERTLNKKDSKKQSRKSIPRRIITYNCDACGVSLSIKYPNASNFIICEFCDSLLEIKNYETDFIKISSFY